MADNELRLRAFAAYFGCELPSGRNGQILKSDILPATQEEYEAYQKSIINEH